MAFRFLHAADLHLGSTTLANYIPRGVVADLAQNAHVLAFERTIEAGLSAAVDFALFAGDSFHRPATDQRLGEVFLNGLARLSDAGIPSFVITGNHDPASVLLGRKTLPPNVFVFQSAPEARILRTLGVAIHGISIADTYSSENALTWYPRPIAGLFNIGLLHTSLLRTDVRTYAPIDPDALLRHGYDYWALGHIHERITYTAEDAILHFPANPQALTSKDTGPRGVTIVSVSDQGKPSLEFAPTAILRFDALDRPSPDAAIQWEDIGDLLLSNGGVPTVVVPRHDESAHQIAELEAAIDAYAAKTGQPVVLARDHAEHWIAT